MSISKINSNFDLLLIGQSISQLGTSLYLMVLVLFLNEITDSATIIGLFLVLTMLPGVFLGPFCGALADRHSRKNLIVLSDFMSGILVISIGVIMTYSPESRVVLFTFIAFIITLKGFLWVVFQTAIYSAIPELVSTRKIVSANGLLQSSMQIADLIGQVLSGFLLSVLGLPLLMILDGFLFIISGISELYVSIPYTNHKNTIDTSNSGSSFKRDLSEVKAYLADNLGLLNLFLLFAMLEFFVGPLFVIIPFYVSDVLVLDKSWYGYFMGTLTGGILLGNAMSILLRFSRSSTGKIVVFLLFIYSLSFGFLGFCSSVGLVVLDLLVMGFCVGFITVMVVSSIQRHTSNHIRGRVIGCLYTIASTLGAFSVGISGVIADLVSNNVRVIFYVFGALVLISPFVFVNSRGFKLLNKSDSLRAGSGC